MLKDVITELAPTGKLRAAINLGNTLLVTGKSASGDPEGVAPDMAREVANRLGVPVAYVPYPRPGDLADDVATNKWDIGLIGADPKRAEKIAFTPPYVEIEATYLVPAGSPIKTFADVDRPGVRIVVSARSAYDLWLSRNIKHAELVRENSIEDCYKRFVEGRFEVLSGLRAILMSDAETLPGSRVLDGRFTTAQQAIGTASQNQAAVTFLRELVAEAISGGLVAQLIERHRARGLTVANVERAATPAQG
jgi:polar amino acid transport system substrate-binding protein